MAIGQDGIHSLNAKKRCIKKFIIIMITPNPTIATCGDPRSNTGSNSQHLRVCDGDVSARIDAVTLLWDLTGSVPIAGAIERFLGVKFDYEDTIARKIGVLWNRNYRSPCGCLYSERDADNGRVHARLSISGSVCARVSLSRLRGFLLWCDSNLFGLRCSRIDLAVDDYTRMLRLEDIQSACEEGNYTGFKKSKSIKNYGEKHGGWTVNLGERTSEKYVRIYDKFAESKGEIDSVRFEVEYSGELSNKLFSLVLKFPFDEQEYQHHIIDYALGCVSFIDKIDKNIDRNEMLDWWKAFIEFTKSEPCRVVSRRIKTDIINKKQWVRRAVSKTLSLLCDALGDREYHNFMHEIKEEAKLRYNGFDNLILWDYQKVSINS